MPKNVNIDDLVPLGRARRELIPYGNNGKPISPTTAWRWVRKGLKSATGERIKLTVVMVGGRPFLTRQAVEDFFARLTEARESAEERDSSDDNELSAAKERKLKEAGLL